MPHFLLFINRLFLQTNNMNIFPKLIFFSVRSFADLITWTRHIEWLFLWCYFRINQQIFRCHCIFRVIHQKCWWFRDSKKNHSRLILLIMEYFWTKALCAQYQFSWNFFFSFSFHNKFFLSIDSLIIQIEKYHQFMRWYPHSFSGHFFSLALSLARALSKSMSLSL